MPFRDFLRQHLAALALAGLSLGVLIAVLLLVLGGVSGGLNLDLSLDRADAVWFALLLPLMLAMLGLLLSPLTFLWIYLGRRLGAFRRGQ